MNVPIHVHFLLDCQQCVDELTMKIAKAFQDKDYVTLYDAQRELKTVIQYMQQFDESEMKNKDTQVSYFNYVSRH